MIPTYFQVSETLCLRHVMLARDAFEYLLLLAIVHLCDRVFLMMAWVC